MDAVDICERAGRDWYVYGGEGRRSVRGRAGLVGIRAAVLLCFLLDRCTSGTKCTILDIVYLRLRACLFRHGLVLVRQVILCGHSRLELARDDRGQSHLMLTHSVQHQLQNLGEYLIALLFRAN